jgi:hypothetical protein
VIEKREHARTSIDIPVTFLLKSGGPAYQGVGRDISLGGMFVETGDPAVFKAEVVVHLQLRVASGAMVQFALPGVVRWVRQDGMGIQFGLLGIHETRAITDLSRA